jgi:phenylpropionate dioxygenase-like ring-hydroxylating dioxygenase large terminal subunit
VSSRIKDMPPGSARCPGLTWNEIIASDSRAAPDFLYDNNYEYRGSEPLAATRYTDPAFFELEKKKMWPRVWQFAARDEDMPEPGDHVVYSNVGRTYLLVRQHDGSVKGFHNVCRHRGRQLRNEGGAGATQFRCPYHGWTWNIDGTNKALTCEWDFPHIDKEKASLIDISVARWGGYIFVREAKTGPGIEEYLAPLPDFFARWPHDECVTVAWVAKVVKANWKTTMEAFIESYHAAITHPQLAAFVGDLNALNACWGDHANLNMSPFATPSPAIDASGKSQQWIIDEYVRYNGRTAAGAECRVPEGGTARRALAELMRAKYSAETGVDVGHISDAEMLDALTFNVFPNLSPWGGCMPNIVYRWRPWPDHRTTLMEVRILVRLPHGVKKPRSPQMRVLREDEPWSSAAELSALGPIFDQDWGNIPYVQIGLEASPDNHVQLGNYQESRIRHFHRTLDKYLAG